jgi:hypothetical protein
MSLNKKIKIELGGSVNSSFAKSTSMVTKKLTKLGQQEKKLKDSQALIGKLKADQMAIGKTSTRLKTQTQKLKELQSEYNNTNKPSSRLKTSISKLQKSINTGNKNLSDQRHNLKQVGQQLKKTGIDTAHLSSEEKRLARAIEKTQKQARFKAKSMQILGSSMRNAKFAVLGVAGAMTAMGAAAYKMAGGFAEHGDKVAKTSDKLGITTDALQKLRYAAERSGVATGTLDTSLQRMVRRVAEAAKGTGMAKAAIQELDLSALELKQLSADKVFGLIADKMELVTNQQDKIRLSMKLFDTEGVALVNTLKGGSKALDQLGKDAVKVGYILNEKSLRSAEKNRDAYLNMSTSIKGLSYTISANLMPKFTEMFQKITRWISQNKTQIGEWLDKFSNGISSLFSGAKKIGSVINTVVDATTGWGLAIKGIGIYLAARLFNKIFKLTSLFKGLFKTTAQGAKSLKLVAKGLGTVAKKSASVTAKTTKAIGKAVPRVTRKSFGIGSKVLGAAKIVAKVGGLAANLVIPDTLGDGTLTSGQVTMNRKHRDIMREIEAAKTQGQQAKANQQYNNQKTNNINITNHVNVQGNGDKESIMQGVQQATQKALFDFHLQGV